MLTFLVSLDFNTKTMRLAELKSLLPVAPHSSSHDIGQARGSHTWDYTTLRADSLLPETAPLSDHLHGILQTFSLLASGGFDQRGHDVEIVVNIAVFFDTPFTTLGFDANLLRRILDRVESLEISCYPRRPETEKT
jgi:hypothetical protein